jgi:1,2-diacylglycerol 3-beta-galactosyltransferase
MPINTLPTVAILLADSGGGHRASALGLSEALTAKSDPILVNLLDDYAPFPFNQFSAMYGPLVNRAPGLYHLIYRASASRTRLALAERSAYPWVRRPITAAFRAAPPDLVISVHPVQNGVPLRALRGMGNPAPFVTVVTDPFTPPVAWFCPGVDLCIVASEAARAVALSAGMAPSKVRVIGLPLRKAFADLRGQPRPMLRKRLGLTPHHPMVLMTGGGAGIGKLLPLARSITHRLAGSSSPAQMTIITGNNHALADQLKAENWPITVTVLGYVEAMADWLAASDLLITKAGPGTLAEAACVGVPMIVTGFIPGQEAGNIAWVEQGGAGLFADDPDHVADLVTTWLLPENPTLAQMSAAALALGTPNAANEIADAVLSLVGCRTTV